MAPPAEHDPRFLAGVEHFNAGDYFEAHEEWESIWLDCGSAERRFYQSLIQAAVALYHWNNGNRTGANRLFRAGREKADPYRPAFLGVDVAEFWRQVEAALTDGSSPPPRIVLGRPPEPDP